MNATYENKRAHSTCVADTLSQETLVALCNREIGVIHAKSFYKNHLSEEVFGRITNHPQLGYYNKLYTSSVGRVCMPHIDAENDLGKIRQYHSESVKNIHDVRDLFSPALTPIDFVRLLLQEYWPSGANIQKVNGRNCFVGAIRVFHPQKSQFYPHHDRLDEEVVAPEIENMVEQLVANVYLQVPSKGGELLLWLREPTEEETETIREVEGLMPETLEKPLLRIKPAAGDLIIFSSRMLHAVTPGEDLDRIGMAAFIGCYGENRPLTYWS